MFNIAPTPFLCIVATARALAQQRAWFDALEQDYIGRIVTGHEYGHMLDEFAVFLPVYSVEVQ